MNIKQLFQDKRKILKILVLITGIIAVGLIAFIGTTYATSLPRFCAVCHIMKPEYATWEASSHSQVACVECHVDPGLINALKHKVVATKELYMYLAKTYQLPIQMTEEIPDSRCLQCHDLKRQVSPSYPGLYIPHEKHHIKGIACVKCHQGVAHGKIESRGITMGGDFNSWDKSKGLQVMTTEFTEPKMEVCMDCHGRRGVTVACEACHSGNMKPDSHRQNSFKTQHGELAKKNIKYCDTCHAYIKAPGVTSQELTQQDDDPVAKYLASIQTGEGSNYVNYAKTNEYCVACHKKKPPSHDQNWPFNHGKAADKNSDNCLVCHSPRSDIQGTTSKAACASCHPSIHNNIPWRKSHPIEVPQKYAILEPKCFQCHVKAQCSTCHQTKEIPKQQGSLAATAQNGSTGASSKNSIISKLTATIVPGGIANFAPDPPLKTPPIKRSKQVVEEE